MKLHMSTTIAIALSFSLMSILRIFASQNLQQEQSSFLSNEESYHNIYKEGTSVRQIKRRIGARSLQPTRENDDTPTHIMKRNDKKIKPPKQWWKKSARPPEISVTSFQTSSMPSLTPSSVSSSQPSTAPSLTPTSFLPSSEPSSVPSLEPSFLPSFEPSAVPSLMHTSVPSFEPSFAPSQRPTSMSSSDPSTTPSVGPTSMSSFEPTSTPSSKPSVDVSSRPSSVPSLEHSSMPSLRPSTSSMPSLRRSSIPSSKPSSTLLPTSIPSSEPSTVPSLLPTSIPSSEPSFTPTLTRSSAPSKPSPSEVDSGSCPYSENALSAESQTDFYFNITIEVSIICGNIQDREFTSRLSSALCEYHNEAIKENCPNSDILYTDCLLTNFESPCKGDGTPNGDRELWSQNHYSSVEYSVIGNCGWGCPTTPFPGVAANGWRRLWTAYSPTLLIKVLQRRGFKKAKKAKVIKVKKVSKCASPFATDKDCAKIPPGSLVSALNNPGYLKQKNKKSNNVALDLDNDPGEDVTAGKKENKDNKKKNNGKDPGSI